MRPGGVNRETDDETEETRPKTDRDAPHEVGGKNGVEEFWEFGWSAKWVVNLAGHMLVPRWSVWQWICDLKQGS